MKDHAERKKRKKKENRTVELGFTVNLKSFLQITFLSISMKQLQ